MDISTKRSASRNADEFFLETLEDLREKVSKRPPRKYQFALIGLLLRKLLLDNHNLVDTVNLKREKVFYRIPVRKGSPDKGYNWSAQATIVLFDFLCSTNRSAEFMVWMEHSPDEAKSVEVCELDLQKFLRVPVNIYHDGQVSTVKDLIDYAAHVFGGAHFSPARKPEQERLERFQKLLSAPYPLELAMLQSIGGVVLRGLQSLETHVRTRYLNSAQ
jgi:hypothetical protein